MNTDWKQFFDIHAVDYNGNCFTQNTSAEVEFIVQELALSKGDSVLDMGCGTGRHSIELARFGCKVTGVDLSEGMLRQARSGALQAGVLLRFIEADATSFISEVPFDAAICICEGSFGLLGADDDPIERDMTILRNIHASLKPGSSFLLTALNAARPIRALGKTDSERQFDLHTQVESEDMSIPGQAGTATIHSHERSFTVSELHLMFRLAGFDVEHIGGGTAGNWGKRPLDPDEMEIMVIARKPR